VPTGRKGQAEAKASAGEAGAENMVDTGSAGGADGESTRPVADLEFVKALIEAVDASGIDSVEITRAGTRVKISKTPPGAVGSAGSAGPGVGYFAPPPPYPGMVAAPGGGNAGSQGAGPVPAAAEAGAAEAGAAAEAKAAAGEASGLVDVKSPMVGTFYRAPAPEAPPYVEVGSRVSKGQTLCILEAMKLMNELESEVEGVVRQVLVDNSEPVEYGQVLFRIDPSG
jgi:acetyl-CoA carboxylase biotin carboxyl carrier protein